MRCGIRRKKHLLISRRTWRMERRHEDELGSGNGVFSLSEAVLGRISCRRFPGCKSLNKRINSVSKIGLRPEQEYAAGAEEAGCEWQLAGGSEPAS